MFTYVIVAVSVLISLCSSESFAVVAPYEAHMKKGVSLLEKDNYKDAIREFRAALKDRPNDFNAMLNLGIALSRSGNKEAETTLKRALYINPLDPRVNLELGIYYFNQSVFTEAKDYLENAVKLSPKTVFSSRAEEYLAALSKKVGAKPWSIDASVGFQYDSNVIVTSNDQPLPQGISRKSDWSAVGYLKGKYHLMKSEAAEASISYSLYQSLHTDLSDFNITQNLFELWAAYAVMPSVQIKGLYAFEYVLVGGDGYDTAHVLSPSLLISEGKGFTALIEYRYKKTNFKDSTLFFNNSDRTGSNNLIGIVQNIPITGTLTAGIGYQYDRDSTRKDYWTYKGNKGFLTLKALLPYNMVLDLYSEYDTRDYEGTNPFSNGQRNDIIHSYYGSLTKVVTDRFSVTIGQSYTRNKSNVSVFDYDRSITSFFVNARF